MRGGKALVGDDQSAVFETTRLIRNAKDQPPWAPRQLASEGVGNAKRVEGSASAQRLIDLLKKPSCMGDERRNVLRLLSTLFKQEFANQWDVFRLAKANNLDHLDFGHSENGDSE